VWNVAPIFVEIVATPTQRRSSALFASKPKPCTSCTQRKNVMIGEAATEIEEHVEGGERVEWTFALSVE